MRVTRPVELDDETPKRSALRYCRHVASARANKLESWWRWTAGIALAITAYRIDVS